MDQKIDITQSHIDEARTLLGEAWKEKKQLTREETPIGIALRAHYGEIEFKTEYVFEAKRIKKLPMTATDEILKRFRNDELTPCSISVRDYAEY